MFKSSLVALLAITAGTFAHAVWLPKPQVQLALHYEYEPLCNEQRQQVQVRLLDGTHFLMDTDVQGGTVLFGVRFKSVGFPVVSTGVIYCEPYVTKQLTFWDGHSANQSNDRRTALGFSQCLVDYDEDGVFDDSSFGGYRTKNAVTSKHQYRYEAIKVEGAPDLSCPRPKAVASALQINEQIWNSLNEEERKSLKDQTEVDVVPVREVGIITHSQKLDASTPGNNSGSALGEVVAAANYIDKSNSNGSYSAMGQLTAQAKGGILGSLLNTSPTSLFLVRYTVKLASGELVSVDKNSKTNGFELPNGMCVTLPAVEQTKQALCESTLAAFKEAHFGVVVQPSAQSNSKEVRLRELKRLFDEGLLSEPVYREQQKKILDN